MTRRIFLKLLGVGVVLSSVPLVRHLMPPSRTLEPTDWAILTKLTDQLIPATPKSAKASDAGVIAFLRQQLASRYRRHAAAYKALAIALEKIAQSRFRTAFRLLDETRAIAVIQEVERDLPKPFQMVRAHTIEGYFSDPRHGGNRDYAGWKAVKLSSHILGIDFL